MAVPTRPVAGAPIETAWGNVAHDTAVAQDIQMGSVTTQHTASKVSGVVTVAFPRAFASPPRVTFGCGNFNYVAARDGNLPSTLGFNIATYRIDQSAPTGPVQVDWVAIGPRA